MTDAPKIHMLKCWPESFRAIRDGVKKYEIRKDDRDFKVGDFLNLAEWIPEHQRIDSMTYTGADLWLQVTYKTPGGSFGLPADLCVLGIAPCKEPTP